MADSAGRSSDGITETTRAMCPSPPRWAFSVSVCSPRTCSASSVLGDSAMSLLSLRRPMMACWRNATSARIAGSSGKSVALGYGAFMTVSTPPRTPAGRRCQSSSLRKGMIGWISRAMAASTVTRVCWAAARAGPPAFIAGFDSSRYQSQNSPQMNAWISVAASLKR